MVIKISKIDIFRKSPSNIRPCRCLNFVLRICGAMSVSLIDSLTSELGSDKAISKSDGWIPRKSNVSIANNDLAQTHQFCNVAPAEKNIAQRQHSKGVAVSTSHMGTTNRVETDQNATSKADILRKVLQIKIRIRLRQFQMRVHQNREMEREQQADTTNDTWKPSTGSKPTKTQRAGLKLCERFFR